ANLYTVKVNLSKYVSLVQKGETVLICKRNIPIAELKAVEKIKPNRHLGGCKGKVTIPDSFFAALPTENPH
ncbi:MAG: type II toxin-antitoxin system Phd/YefM family antitoxin, partial [bacterium]